MSLHDNYLELLFLLYLQLQKQFYLVVVPALPMMNICITSKLPPSPEYDHTIITVCDNRGQGRGRKEMETGDVPASCHRDMSRLSIWYRKPNLSNLSRSTSRPTTWSAAAYTRIRAGTRSCCAEPVPSTVASRALSPGRMCEGPRAAPAASPPLHQLAKQQLLLLLLLLLSLLLLLLLLVFNRLLILLHYQVLGGHTGSRTKE